MVCPLLMRHIPEELSRVIFLLVDQRLPLHLPGLGPTQQSVDSGATLDKAGDFSL